MLEQHGGGDGVDVAFSPARGPTHFLDRALCGGGRKPLVDEANRKPAALRQQLGYAPSFGATLGFVAFLVEWQADHESLGLERAGTVEYLPDGRPFPGAPEDVAGGGRDRARRVAYGQSYSPISEVNR